MLNINVSYVVRSPGDCINGTKRPPQNTLNEGSPILTHAGIGRPAGQPHIQHRAGASSNATQNKGNYSRTAASPTGLFGQDQ